MSRKFLTPLQLPADPTNPLEAATKQYVDGLGGNYVDLSSPQTISGAKTFSTLPLLTVPSAADTLLASTQLTGASYRMWYDRLRFSSPTFETSPDGTTWTAGGVGVGLGVLTGRSDQYLNIDNAVRYVRWTWNDVNMSFSAMQRLVLKFGYANPAPSVIVTVESGADGVVWRTLLAPLTLTTCSANVHTTTITDHGSDPWFRITMQVTGGGSSGTVCRPNGIEMQTARWGDQGSANEREMPYYWDYSRLMAFYNTIRPSADNAFDLGTSGIRWRSLYLGGTAQAGALSTSVTSGEMRRVVEVRTMPTAVDSTVHLGTATFRTGTGSVRIAITADMSGYSVTRIYEVAVQYNATAGAWRIVPWVSGTPPYSGGADFQLEAMSTTSTTQFRIRNISGALAASAVAAIDFSSGSLTWAPATTVTAGVAAVTAYWPTSMQATELRTVKIDSLSPGASDIVLGTSINANGKTMYGFPTPVNSDWAATKGYVDSQVGSVSVGLTSTSATVALTATVYTLVALTGPGDHDTQTPALTVFGSEVIVNEAGVYVVTGSAIVGLSNAGRRVLGTEYYTGSAPAANAGSTIWRVEQGASTGVYNQMNGAIAAYLPAGAHVRMFCMSDTAVSLRHDVKPALMTVTRASGVRGDQGLSGPANQPQVDIYSTAGAATWNKPPSAVYVQVEVIGGGGSGGGAATTDASSWSFGDGGGGGEYARATFAASALGATEAITVGAGGTGTTGVGATGGTSSFGTAGTLVTAIGGGGGAIRPASTNLAMSNNGAARAGGTGGTGGQVRRNGGAGGGGFAITISVANGRGGDGGASVFAGAVPGVSHAAGTPATNYGGGGSGAHRGQSGTAVTGGNGAGGLVIVTTYF